MSVRNGCIRVLGLSLLSPLVFAADLPGSQDLPAVARQVDAQIVDYRPAEEKERIYPMGAIRKISGQLRYEGQAIARGQATAITYELPAEHSASAAFTTTREALQEKGAQLLFWCKARDCGESSLWANEIFGNAKLVGADSQQEYLLLRLAEPQANSWWRSMASPVATAAPICMWSNWTPARHWAICCLPRRPCCAS